MHSRLDATTATHISEPLLILRGKYQRKSCWTIADKVAFIDTIMKGWTCAPIYIIEEKKADHVFDGAHKLETVSEFISDQFAIEKVSTVNWEKSPLTRYIGSKFSDFDEKDQRMIRGYTFDVNVIDEKTANDALELEVLWNRLNNSGKRLNKFECAIPLYHDLNDIMSGLSKQWLESRYFQRKDMSRGRIEEFLMILLALSEPEIPVAFSSFPNIYERWRQSKFGRDVEKLQKMIMDHKIEMSRRLDFMFKIYKMLETHGVFRRKVEQNTLETVIARIAVWCSTPQKLNRCEPALIEFVHALFSCDLCKQLECYNRNADFQKKMIDYVNRNVQTIVNEKLDRRLFTPVEKAQKLLEQNGQCAGCLKYIDSSEPYEGDHIVKWINGGVTEMHNLQVLCKSCHMRK
jgi:hypothetical protein